MFRNHILAFYLFIFTKHHFIISHNNILKKFAVFESIQKHGIQALCPFADEQWIQ